MNPEICQFLAILGIRGRSVIGALPNCFDLRVNTHGWNVSASGRGRKHSRSGATGRTALHQNHGNVTTTTTAPFPTVGRRPSEIIMTIARFPTVEKKRREVFTTMALLPIVGGRRLAGLWPREGQMARHTIEMSTAWYHTIDRH